MPPIYIIQISSNQCNELVQRNCNKSGVYRLKCFFGSLLFVASFVCLFSFDFYSRSFCDAAGAVTVLSATCTQLSTAVAITNRNVLSLAHTVCAIELPTSHAICVEDSSHWPGISSRVLAK